VIALGAVLALSFTAARPSLAQEEPPAGYDVSLAVDGAITGGLIVGSVLLSLWPVDTSERWSSEFFGHMDESVKDNFSERASALSDTTLVTAMLAPALLQLPGGWNGDTGRQLLLYGQAVGASVFLQSFTKRLVQRPRPYNYHRDQRVAEFARGVGKDSHASFYSGHASTAFAAAVAGSYLFASSSGDREINALVWLFEMTLAGATANLRVRAGRHFYSDVVTGAVVGSAIGFLVPALHADGDLYRPSGLEWAALAGGVVLGVGVSQLLPVDSTVGVPLLPESVRLVPMADERGTGMALAGWF
jgi:membrane-associated phospholipid phosphatase